MTMPHLSNCPHKSNSWCLDCVGDIGRRLIDSEALSLRRKSRCLALEEKFKLNASVMTMTEKCFSEDHVVEWVAGDEHPERCKALGTLAHRAAWISKKLDAVALVHGPKAATGSCYYHELKAIVYVTDLIKQKD